MEYKLKFNESGNLQGFQYIKYELQGMIMDEQHYIAADGSECIEEFEVQVFNPRTLMSYFFNGKAWGTPEIARDAAERFAVYGDLDCVQSKVKGFWVVKPNNEEALI